MLEELDAKSYEDIEDLVVAVTEKLQSGLHLREV